MYIGTSVDSPNGTYTVSVIIDGTEQPLWRRERDNKVFVAGEPGKAYTLRVLNRRSSRIEVINGIDGRNTLKDGPADAVHNTGLVFSGHSSGEFTGWRLDNETTRAFVFGRPEHSIAAQATGSASNVGIIGFAAYTELTYRPRTPSWGYTDAVGYRGGYEQTRGDLGAVTEAARSAAPPATMSPKHATRGGSLGTGMGEARTDRVGTTSFRRESGYPDILAIGYDTEDVLREQGIIVPIEPQPFPGIDTGYSQYQTIPHS